MRKSMQHAYKNFMFKGYAKFPAEIFFWAPFNVQRHAEDFRALCERFMVEGVSGY